METRITTAGAAAPGSVAPVGESSTAGVSVPPDHPSAPDAFVSYARVNVEVVRRLHAGLTARGRDIWVDWEDIHPSEAFMQAIERAVATANVFVFVISPDSVRSEICRRELEYAMALGKKLVPLLHREVARDLLPPALAELNWIFVRETDEVATAVDSICQAFDTDLDWLRTHTRLSVRALEWDRNQRNRSYLLQGVDLDHAERALAAATAQHPPEPTSLQREYVLTSRRRSSARLRTLLAGVSIALVVAATLATLAEMQRRQAVEARRRGLARQLAAQSELVRRPWGEPLILSGLLAAESLRQYPSLEGDLAMRRALALLPRPVVNVTSVDSANTRQLSPDGRLVAAAFDDGRIQLLDTFTGQRIAEMKQTPATSVMWSRDGRYLVTGDANSVMRIWSAERRDTIARFDSAGQPGIVAFSADGARLAFASESDIGRDTPHPVVIHDLANNRRVARFTVTRGVRALALDSTGHRIVVLTSEFMSSAVEIRDEPFRQVLTERRLDGRIEQPAVNASGTLIAFVNPISHIGGGTSGKNDVVVETIEPGIDGGVRLESSRLPHPCEVASVQLSPEGERVVTTCEDHSVRVWMPNGEPVAQLTGLERTGRVAVGPAAQTIAVPAGDSMTHLFAVSSARHVASIPQGGDLAFTTDGRHLTVLDGQGHVAVWETRAGSEVRDLTMPGSVHSLHFSPDDSTVSVCRESGATLFPLRRDGVAIALGASRNALGCAWTDRGSRFLTVSASGVSGGAGGIEVLGDDDIRVWDGAAGRELIRRPRSSGTDFALSDNGLYVAIAQRNDTIEISRADSGRVVRVVAIPPSAKPLLPGDTAPPGMRPLRMTSLRFSPTGDHFAMYYDERYVLVWDVRTGTARPVIDVGPRRYIAEVAPDGRRLITTNVGSITSSSELWDVLTAREIKLSAPDVLLHEIVFSSDGKRLATVTAERVVHVWDAERLREIGSFTAPARIFSLTFAPDARAIATGGSDQTARVWDVATGRELARMNVGFDVFGLTFSHRGDRLAVSGVDGDVLIESWRPPDLLGEAEARTSRNLTLDEWQTYLPDERCRRTFPTRPDGCRSGGANR